MTRAKREVSREVPAGALIRFLSALILAFLLLCVPGCGLFAPRTTQPPPAGSLVVSFIDVGQGDAVLVQSGGKNYLIDAGRPEEGPKVVDFLRSRGVESLEAVVVTNPRNSQNT